MIPETERPHNPNNNRIFHIVSRFIEFGRGKVIPLTPDSSTDLPNEICNTGKIVVKKRIPKIEKGDSIQLSDNAMRSANGKMMQRKKKGRLYSLGGNEPMKKPRGRLNATRSTAPASQSW